MTTTCLSFYKSLPVTKSNQLSLASLNILADDYVTEEEQASTHLTWPYRLSKLRAHLVELNADILCLQEVQLRSFESDLLAFMREHGYEGKVQETNHIVGVATFFRTSKLSLEWSESRSRAMLVGLRLRASQQEQEQQEEQEREREDGSVQFSIQVCNVHLEGHHRETAKRFSQMKSLLKRCQVRLGGATQPADALVFICGDFNSDASGGAVRVLEEGKLGPEVMEAGGQTTPTAFEHGFRLGNAYRRAEEIHPTFFRSFLVSTIDHIFHPAEQTETVGVLSIRKHELHQFRETCLPNPEHPSDHLPVGAVFELTAKAFERARRKTKATT